MNKILILTLLVAGIFITSKAQELTPGNSNHSFIELNAGFVFIDIIEIPGRKVCTVNKGFKRVSMLNSV